MAFASAFYKVMNMRIPTDIPLAKYIRWLIKEGKLERFYWTEDWKELREEVKRELHNECQECLKKGEYTRADCVHHVNEVKDRPDLALSKFYTDEKGKQQRNLITLCNGCHNIIHEKLKKHREQNRFTNVERW